MKSVKDLPKTTFGGRRFTRRQLARVQETVETFSGLSRKELALTVCEHLDWRNPAGRLKVQSCLTLLEALETHGVITLPAKRITKKPVRKVPTFDERLAPAAIEGDLDSVTPVSLRVVTIPEDRERWKAYLQTYHYLGYKHPFGAHLGYLVVSEPLQQELGCLVFSASAAWALAPRDRWIGWDKEHREKLLSLILSNDRFLILPWVKVPNLASHVLSLASGQIGNDWVDAHGYRPVLIETFVDPTRFSGACYQAANWKRLGETQGRGRDDPHHERRETKKDLYVYPLRSDWRECLTQGHRKAELQKRYRNDLASSRQRSVDDAFIALWERVVDILHEAAAEYDERWRVRKRVIGSMVLMLLVFRLVSSKNSQSYGTTIDELWDSCDRLKISLPQKSSIAPSSFCAARKKLDESIFRDVNQKILAAYAPAADRYLWRAHRLFAIDGTKINLPRDLVTCGYTTPNQDAHYPQGLVSCLYELRSQLPFDFDLVSHSDERRCARKHLGILRENDVVVYDRGYFSYALLHQHTRSGVHAVFRLQTNSSSVIRQFFAGNETDKIVSFTPSRRTQQDLRKKHPDLDIAPITIRLLKYEVSGSVFCLGTTLVKPHQQYPIREFMDVYHSRWGVEELFKVSKQLFAVDDFHAKTERGVKQELFAHFVLITMNRLFANQTDIALNPGQGPSSPPAESSEHDLNTKTQTNFKNCIHVLQRSLEEIVLLQGRIRTAVQSAFDMILRRHHTTRPGRSYARISHKTETRWRLSKEKKKRRKTHLATVATSG